eukprot:gb/GECG01015726.1/.p1 GENE.gb/GECG01015726.1/~~gb/GECG01015726.1/.p1  ORF type:complete len:131 (+),score=16.73 gb/GECG01015726.1/:1-393(+)
MASNNSTDGYESQKDRVRDYVTGLARQMGMGDELEEETRDDMVDKAYQVDQRDKKDAQARLWRDTDNDRRFPNVNQSQNCWYVGICAALPSIRTVFECDISWFCCFYTGLPSTNISSVPRLKATKDIQLA